MNISRRAFLKSGGVAMIGMSTMPAFLRRAVAATPMPNRKKLVVLFQRGAADGLNIVVPFGEPNYYRIRPSIAIPAPRQGAEGAALDLDGFFGLHPSLAPLLPLFQNSNWPSSTPPDRRTPRVRTSTRRITWNRARPA